MTLTLDLPFELEHQLQRQAEAKHLRLNQLIEELITTTLGYQHVLEAIQHLPQETIPELLRFIDQLQAKPAPNYSFIGIGRSGDGHLSTNVKATLAETSDRQEGWALPR